MSVNKIKLRTTINRKKKLRLMYNYNNKIVNKILF